MFCIISSFSSKLCENDEKTKMWLYFYIYTVYLRSTPETVHNRMIERGRSEEAGVPLEYLKQVFRSDLTEAVHTDLFLVLLLLLLLPLIHFDNSKI